jgi:hypothetical protein
MSRIARAHDRHTHEHHHSAQHPHIALTYPGLPQPITTFNVSTNQNGLHAVPTRRVRLIHHVLPSRKFQRGM